MAEISFGTGLLSVIPSGATPTPIQIGVVQGVSLKVSEKVIKLYGANKVPVDIAKGETEITGKFKFAQLNPALVAAVLSGAVTTSGKKTTVSETATIPGTPYQVTATNSATWSEDLGVYDNTASKPLARVASAPATGEYAVTAGVYTYAAADTGHSVTYGHSYTTASVGKTVSYSNQPMGTATLFALRFGTNYNSKTMLHELPAVVIPGFSLELQNTAHTVADCDFEAMADPATNLVYKSYWAE